MIDMDNQKGMTNHKRINVSLSEDTLELLDRVSEKGNRSDLVDKAVRFYIKEVGRTNLKKQLRLGAIENAKRDLRIAEEWFSIDEEVWEKTAKR